VWEDLRRPEIAWSSSFVAAAWIRDRLHPFGSREIGSVVPDGFESYVAIRHPHGNHELPAEDLLRLSQVLDAHTSTPTWIWYCMWDGYAWMHGGAAVSGRPPGVAPLDVQAGGRVRLPAREYYLYSGDLSVAFALMADPWRLQPNLWWPQDHAWCVATEIDLVVTYVGGSMALVESIAGDSTFHARPVTPDDSFQQGWDYIH
jgi:hypothetical protein